MTRRAREAFDEIIIAAAELARDHGSASYDLRLNRARDCQRADTDDVREVHEQEHRPKD
jgi:hypothetical protein